LAEKHGNNKKVDGVRSGVMMHYKTGKISKFNFEKLIDLLEST
jgi:hypothetical protein